MGALRAMLLLVGLASCTTAACPDPCAGWAAIYPAVGEASRLSPQLREQLLAHNRQGQSLCGWQP
jgi:hypothetical protein